MRSVPDAYSDGLACLRGIAACVVVVFHALLIFRVGSFDDPNHLPLQWGDGWLLLMQAALVLFNGKAAVTLFFVLSGAVLALSLAREPRFGAVGWTAYLIKRLFRLYPLLVAATLAAAWLHHAYFTEGNFVTTTDWMNQYYQRDPGLRETLVNATGYRNNLNSPAWTIFIEICASLLFPLLYFFAARPAHAAAMTGVLVVLAFLPIPMRNLNVFLICFFVGALIPTYGRSLAQGFHRLPKAVRLATIGVALLVMTSFRRFYAPEASVDPLTVLVQTGCSAFLVAIVYFSPPIALFQRPWARALGEMSYGIYLLHFAVLFMLAHAIAPHLGDAIDPTLALLLNVALAAATLAITLPLAWFFFRGIERPFQRLGRRLARLMLDLTSTGGPQPAAQRLPAQFSRSADARPPQT